MLSAAKRRLRSLLADLPRRANYKFLVRDWLPLLELRHASQVLETKRFTRNLRPVRLERPEGQRFVVLAPHPDDDTFGVGGTLLKLRDAGAELHIVYATVPARSDAQREGILAEAQQVCDKLGATFHLLDLPSGAIPVDAEARTRLRELLHGIDPDVVFTTFLLDDHDDHRRINHLLAETYRGEAPRFEVWAYQIYTTVLPNVVVEITAEMPEKMALMQTWTSVQGNRNWPHFVRGMNAANCRYIAGREEVYAEAFFAVPAREYFDLCGTYFSQPAAELYFKESYKELGSS